MIPTKLSELKLGMQFYFYNMEKYTIEVMKIEGDLVTVAYTDVPNNKIKITADWFFDGTLTYKYVSEYKREYLCELPTTKCQHTWREDRFFSAMVYTTCTKCGAKREDK